MKNINIISSSSLTGLAIVLDRELQTWSKSNKAEVARLHNDFYSVKWEGKQFLVLKEKDNYTFFVQDNELLCDRIAVLSHSNRQKMAIKILLFILKNPKP